MKRLFGHRWFMVTMLVLSIVAFALPPVPERQERKSPAPNGQRPTADSQKPGANGQRPAANGQRPAANGQRPTAASQAIIEHEDSFPDSLLKTRWKVQQTLPVENSDLSQNSADLRRPDNLKQDAVYNDTLGGYLFGTKMSGTWVEAPLLMSPQEYMKWTEKNLFSTLNNKKNAELFQSKGKEKFDFTDMHFSLGPAEKIFGPGGVRVTTQGTAELKLGGTHKNIQNPSLPISRRKTLSVDFDEKINFNMQAKVGDKVNMNLNYNTDATFNYDAQNMKLKYDGKEDEIIKLVEAGNVSFPSNSSLVNGASSLFGIRSDWQFGKLKLQTVISQKKSSSQSVSSKGGVQLTPFEMDVTSYDENRHFFLSHYFHDNYDNFMRTLPTPLTGITINRVEIWVTNTSGSSSNSRDIIAFSDLGEAQNIKNSFWHSTTELTTAVPYNGANNEYSTLVSLDNDGTGIRSVDQTTDVMQSYLPALTGGNDFEKLEKARLLTSSEYTLNQAMGYVSLSSALKTDQVLAVAFEYTYQGQTYQVGEFASDITDTNKALFVKSLKNTSNTPSNGNWRLMMRNVYKLSSSLQKEKFRLDVKYQSDTTGVYISYIPEPQTKSQTIIRLLGADRLDNNNKANPNGYFDYVEGYTVKNGCVFFPLAEPFGAGIKKKMMAAGVDSTVAMKYAFMELYDTVKTVAKQVAEKNKFLLTGQYKGSRENVISLGAYNVPRGSVVVTAGGMTLTEGTDYTVDYSSGEVTILNQSIIDAGTSINASCESNTEYGQTRKTMFGVNWSYDFSKDFQLSGTLQHLSEQALTNKVSMGTEPLNNTIWGININWKHEAQWLTSALNWIPFLHVSQPSTISFQGEFAQLIAGKSSNTQDNASYIDDFDNTEQSIDVSTPSSWTISSIPQNLPNCDDKTSLASGFQRAKLAWYTIDPLFTNRSSSLTPAYIKGDLEQLSNHYVREVYVNELYPNRDQSSYNGATSTLSILNLAYYPQERGPYNFTTKLNSDGTLADNPQDNWGGMMRKLDTSDFENANVGYVEFWMLDPYIYLRRDAKTDFTKYSGTLYIDLGEISEDVLKDGKRFYESGMPVDGTNAVEETQWGKVPNQATITYAFATSDGSREKQDVGLDGLTDAEEKDFYSTWLSQVKPTLNDSLQKVVDADPAADDYQYFRSSAFDAAETPILMRYKNINNPQGNSPDSSTRTESYDTSYKTTPDVEDINQDYTLNEYDKYFEYPVDISPTGLQTVGQNYIVDTRVTAPKLRNGKSEEVTWYKFRIPVTDWKTKVGTINDYSSIRFMRMYMKGFSEPIILRFGNLDLIRDDWRLYTNNLDNVTGSGEMTMAKVDIEQDIDKQPVNYTLPPGISRETDPSQPQLVQSNEEALSLNVRNLSTDESKCVYKNATIDMRQYKRLQLFVHANAYDPNETNLQDEQLALFVRLGSDYKSNYYEYEIPLKLTPKGQYDQYSLAGCQAVWPEDNMLNIPISIFTDLKKNRNKAKNEGTASYTQPYSDYDADAPKNKVTVVGNPSLGEVKTMVIGVRNKSGEPKSGEVWVNEMRMLEYDNSGGWAAQGNLNIQLSDFGTLNLQGKYVTQGFGGLEDGVAQRSQTTDGNYTVTTSVELGKFFPEKANVTIPVYYSLNKQSSAPKYNPLDTDMRLKDALEAAKDKHEKDSINSLAVTKTLNTNFSLSNMKVGIKNKRHPTPIDPANFSFSYSHSHKHTTGETTVYENEDNWKGGIDYSWTPVIKAIEPWKKSKSKSKWMDMLKQFQFNWLPQNVSFGTDINRSYYELQERDMESLDSPNSLPVTFSKQFLWNRDFALRWDFTKNIHMNFTSATKAEVEEPYVPVNKDLYPDEYSAWKDSIWTSLKHLGTPLDFAQTFSLQIQSPLDKLPIFDWTKADASYKSNYTWVRGTTLEDGTNLGNTITNSREMSFNGTINLEKLYNHIPFLKNANETMNKEKRAETKNDKKRTPMSNPKNARVGKDGKNQKTDAKDEKSKLALDTKKKGFEQEIVLKPDTTVTVKHGKKTKRIIVSGRNEKGKLVPVKYKVKDENTIVILNKVDSATNIKVTVMAKPDLDDQKWYKALQVSSRILMMVRSFSLSYRNKQSLSLPGYMPMVGAAFGQKSMGGVMAPGLGFAFGLEGEDFISKARDNDWLLMDGSAATPAATSATEDVQLKATLEPWKNFKIDLSASRTATNNKSIQYMYEGTPTTLSGSFTMTTISLKSAFGSSGNAENGYYNKSFDNFCNSLESFRKKVESRYKGAIYPEGTSLAGQKFDAANGGVGKYSADVLIPAFLASYTNTKSGLSLFPALTSILPNWSVKFSGIGKLPWMRDHFKAFNINHAYKSIYAVGSYSSFSTFHEYMDGLGFITDATTDKPIPNSMYNISTVSLNEAFSPLLGVDFTMNNNMSIKAEYKTTRVLTLSTTSIQINETSSHDWVIGCGYKFQNFSLFSKTKSRKIKGSSSSGKNGQNDKNTDSKSDSKSSSSSKNELNHDLNLKLDFSLRDQAAITRDITTATSAASSGNKALKISFTADYTVSKLLTMSFYYDIQRNQPLLSSNSYPTTTQDFGLSIKFSLRR